MLEHLQTQPPEATALWFRALMRWTNAPAGTGLWDAAPREMARLCIINGHDPALIRASIEKDDPSPSRKRPMDGP